MSEPSQAKEQNRAGAPGSGHGRGKPARRGGGRGGKGPGGKPGKGPRGKVRREHSAGILLFRETPEGRVWLLLDYGKHWDFAKGHLEEGETTWRAAVRETREETGIRQVDRVGKWQRDMEYQFYSSKKGRVHKTVTYFVGLTRTVDVKLSEEHSGYAWLPIAEALERVTFDNARDFLQAAEQFVASRKPG